MQYVSPLQTYLSKRWEGRGGIQNLGICAGDVTVSGEAGLSPDHDLPPSLSTHGSVLPMSPCIHRYLCLHSQAPDTAVRTGAPRTCDTVGEQIVEESQASSWNLGWGRKIQESQITEEHG